MPAGAGVLRVDGPILNKHIDVFGAKLGLALHFEAHGSAVPPTGGVQPMFFTNVSALRGELPNEIFGLLPTPRTLKQGKREVGDQFQYSWALTEEKRHSVFYATFRQSFAIAAVTALDRSEFLERNADKYPITIPGAFKTQTLIASARLFPPPWTAEETETCFIVRDHKGQALTYVYFEEGPGRQAAANLLTRDEARRIA